LAEGKNHAAHTKAYSREALDTAITDALGVVTAVDTRGGFRHCGYAIH
jgi:hypothetical protein